MSHSYWQRGLAWSRVFEQLLQRGLTGVTYVVSDEHAGLVQAIHRFLPDAGHQRCQVHYLRNALDRVSSKALAAQLVLSLKDVCNAPTRAIADLRAATLIAELRPTVPALADWLEATVGDTLTVFCIPSDHALRRLRTTNGIEHDHMAVRRRTNVIRVFPNEASFLRLASALAMDRNDKWLVRRYILLAPARLAPETLMPAA